MNGHGAGLVLVFLIGLAPGTSSAQPPQRELTVGQTSKEFQAEFDKRLKNDFAPVSFSAHYDSRGKVRTATVWENRTEGKFGIKAGLTQKATTELVKKMITDGYRLEHLSAMGRGGERYSSIWILAPGQQLAVRYGFPLTELMKRHKEFTNKQYAIQALTVFRDKGKTFYTAAWEKAEFAERVFYADATLAAFMKQTRERPKKGFRLRQVYTYVNSRRQSIACIWEKTAGPPQVVEANLTEAALKRTMKKMAGSGHSPTMITGLSLGGRDRYVVVWEKTGKK